MDIQFDIYDNCLNNLMKVRAETDIDFICSTTEQLPKENRDVLLGIIFHYYLKAQKNFDKSVTDIKKKFRTTRTKKFIFSSTILSGGKGIAFKFKEFPTELQDIVHTYLRSISIIY